MSQAAMGRRERRGRVGSGRGLRAGEGLAEEGEGREAAGGEVGAMPSGGPGIGGGGTMTGRQARCGASRRDRRDVSSFSHVMLPRWTQNFNLWTHTQRFTDG